MRLVYFDEAGIASITNEPITIVASVPIDGDREWAWIESYVESIVESQVPEQSRANFEFHAAHLFGGHKSNQSWGRDKRWKVLRAFLQTFLEFNLPIVWMGQDRQKVADVWKPPRGFRREHLGYLVAFALCLQNVNQWFRRYAPDEKGICIADEPELKEVRRFMRGALKSWRKQPAVPEWWFTRLDHIIEAVSFLGAHHSIGVQLADAANFFIKRHEMGIDQGSEQFWEMIKGRATFGTTYPRSLPQWEEP